MIKFIQKISIPVQFLNVSIYNYIVKNGNDFAVMNYMFVGLFAIYFLLPVMVYIIVLKYPEKNLRRYAPSGDENCCKSTDL